MLRYRRELERPLSVVELAAFLGTEWRGRDSVTITGVAPLRSASETDLSYCTGHSYRDEAVTSLSCAVIACPSDAEDIGDRALIVADPRKAFYEVILRFCSVPLANSTAPVSPTASIDSSAHICAGVTIGDAVSIGAETVIGPNAVIMHGVRIGDRVRIGPGTVIGADGFGFFADDRNRRIRVPHVGNVVIEDDVEIGSNCTIDRGSLGDTVICSGVKIDSLVHVGHGVHIGRDALIVAQSGISGSVTLGDRVMMGGQAGISDHVTIAPGVRIGSRAAVMKSISTPGITVSGTPARPIIEHLRAEAGVRGIRDLVRRVRELETRIGRESGDS